MEYVSNIVTLTYGAITEQFTALYANDEDYEIISLPNKRLDWTLLENITGHRNIYTVKIQQITSAQRNFLYKYIQSDDQNVTINGVSHSVYLRDGSLLLNLLDGYIDNVVLDMEFEDKTLTRQTVPARAQGYVTLSAGYNSISDNTVGTRVQLNYNYGQGVTSRNFAVNGINFYRADILDKRWEYVDKNRGIRRLGYRLNYDIDFGGFGLGQTQSQLQDDRDFIKEFVLAPYKYISGKGVYLGEIVNSFQEVRYSLIGNSIYDKTTKLSFKSKSLITNVPTVTLEKDNPDPTSSTQFILDDNTFGRLDHNVLG
jgi:hypothetical protein